MLGYSWQERNAQSCRLDHHLDPSGTNAPHSADLIGETEQFTHASTLVHVKIVQNRIVCSYHMCLTVWVLWPSLESTTERVPTTEGIRVCLEYC